MLLSSNTSISYFVTDTCHLPISFELFRVLHSRVRGMQHGTNRWTDKQVAFRNGTPIRKTAVERLEREYVANVFVFI